MNNFSVGLAAVHENHQEQQQLPGHPDDLVPLFSVALDEVVVGRYMVGIVDPLLYT
jgi:hypothetical protein